MTYSSGEGPVSRPAWARRHTNLIPMKVNPTVNYGASDDTSIMSSRRALAACTRCCRRGCPQPPPRCWLLGRTDLLLSGERDLNHCRARRAVHRLGYLYSLPMVAPPVISVNAVLDSEALCSAVENEVNTELSCADSLLSSPENDGSLRSLLWRRAESVLSVFGAALNVPLLRATLYLSLVFGGSSWAGADGSFRVDRSQLAALAHVSRVSPGTPLLFVAASETSLLYTSLIVLALLVCGVSMPVRVVVGAAPPRLAERVFAWLLRRAGVTVCRPGDPVRSAAADALVLTSLSAGQHWLLSVDVCHSLFDAIVSAHADGRLTDAFIVPVSVSDSVPAPSVDSGAGVWSVFSAAWRYLTCSNQRSSTVCLELGEPMRLSELSKTAGAPELLQRHLVFSSGACSAIHTSHMVALLLLYGFPHGCRLQQLSTALKQLCGDLRQRGAPLAERGPPGDWVALVRRAVGLLAGLVLVRERADDAGDTWLEPRPGAVCRRRLAAHAEPCLPWLLLDALIVRAVSVLSPYLSAVLSGLEIERAESVVSGSSLQELATAMCPLLGLRWGPRLAPPCLPLEESVAAAVLSLQRAGVLVEPGPRGTRPVTEGEQWAGRAFLRLRAGELSDDEEGCQDTVWLVRVPEGGLELLSMLLALTAPLLETLCVTTVCLARLLLDGGVCERDHFVEQVLDMAHGKITDGKMLYGYYCCPETIGDALDTLVNLGVVDVSHRSGVSLLSLNKEYSDEACLHRMIHHVFSVL